MIEFLIGTFRSAYTNYIVIQCGSVGYSVYMRGKDIKKIKKEYSERNDLFLHTYYSHIEDSVELYGFLNEKNKKMFLEIIKIHGIGKNTALNIINEFNHIRFKKMKESKSFSELNKVKGIGKKIIEAFIEFYKKDKS